MFIRKEDFGPGFTWGVSTAAYQIEGAHNVDGKGPSIWDDFVNRKRKINDNHTGNIACDFYTQYAKDISLLFDLNISNYRFSVSWSRILPFGTGPVNYKGIDFYNKVIDFCLELGIEPWITIYHWDLPLELEKKGGWTNRDVISWFGEYVEICIKYFGDRVKHWMVLNEPMVFTGAGYFLGVHAPGKKGLSSFLAAVHHAALCQSAGGRIIRGMKPEAHIGTTFSCSHIEPFRPIEKDVIAAEKADAFLNRLFIEPLLGKNYPVRDLPVLQRIERYVKQGDEQDLVFDMDFIGIQNYTREMVSHSPFMPFVKAKIIKADKRNVERTMMNWEIYPESIYEMLKKFNRYENVKELVITENGAAFADNRQNGKVDDPKRIQFLQDNLAQVYRAKQEGINVSGYFIWTLLDNFEWAEGYHPRFGLVYVDFETQQRIVKSSGLWYKRFLSDTENKIVSGFSKTG